MAQLQVVVYDTTLGAPRNAKPSDVLNIPTSKANVDSFINANAGTLNQGQAVYVNSSGNIDLAEANAPSTSAVVGLVFDNTIASGSSGSVIIDGPITLTTAQWDAIAGTTGGLTVGKYYLSPTVAGSITSTCPSTSGQYAVTIGRATSSTTLYVRPAEPFAL